MREVVLQQREEFDRDARRAGASGTREGEHPRTGAHSCHRLREDRLTAQEGVVGRWHGAGDHRDRLRRACGVMAAAGARERPPPLLDRGEAIGRRFCQGAFDGIDHRFRHVRTPCPEIRDRLDRVPHHHRGGGGASEGGAPGEHLVHDASQGVEVTPRVDYRAAGLLGAGVRGRRDRHAGDRHAGDHMRGIARGADGLRDADVGHHRVAMLEENTVRCKTAMQYAAPVGVA